MCRITIPCAGHGQSICCVLQVSDSKLGESRGPHQVGKPSQRNSRAGRREGGRDGGGGREDRGSRPTVILFPIMVDAPSNI